MGGFGGGGVVDQFGFWGVEFDPVFLRPFVSYRSCCLQGLHVSVGLSGDCKFDIVDVRQNPGGWRGFPDGVKEWLDVYQEKVGGRW